MIYLDFAIEQPLLNIVLRNPKKITILPEETYNKFHKYLLQEELYEHMGKLESVKDRLTTKTLEELLEEAERNNGWEEVV